MTSTPRKRPLVAPEIKKESVDIIDLIKVEIDMLNDIEKAKKSIYKSNKHGVTKKSYKLQCYITAYLRIELNIQPLFYILDTLEHTVKDQIISDIHYTLRFSSDIKRAREKLQVATK
jgi:hypothetical protein